MISKMSTQLKHEEQGEALGDMRLKKLAESHTGHFINTLSSLRSDRKSKKSWACGCQRQNALTKYEKIILTRIL